MIDGFDVQVMGYVTPSLLKMWHVERDALASVTSAGLFGLMIGALALGTLGDRFGRRTVIVASVVVIGVFELATVFVRTPGEMMAVRFLTGLGLGGVMPSAIALVSEYMPARLRATMVTITVGGFAIGPAIGGFLAGPAIHDYGWRSVFIAGGVLPLAVAPLLWWLLPESNRFLFRRPDAPRALARNMRRVFPDANLPLDGDYFPQPGALPKAPTREIFAGGRMAGTLLLWSAIFLNLLGINLQTSWMPLIMTGMGFGIKQAVGVSAMFHLGGAIGGILFSRILERFDFWAIGVIFLLAGLAIIGIGFVGADLNGLRISIFVAGLFVVGGQSCLGGLSGLYYPADIRSTGAGWALGIGRFGAVAGPLIGGSLMLLHLPLQRLFLIEAIPFFLTALAAILIKFSPQGKLAR
jgi:AAHS family 4-hydroxybenzoate transporter-like MFS transporter